LHCGTDLNLRTIHLPSPRDSTAPSLPLTGGSRSGFTWAHEHAQLSQILEHLAEDDRLNVYAGELEVRPPGAPTIGPD
jgi:hypothetical protein